MRISPIIALPAVAGTVGVLLIWGMGERKENSAAKADASNNAASAALSSQNNTFEDIDGPDLEAGQIAAEIRKESAAMNGASTPSALPTFENGVTSRLLSKPNDPVRIHPGYRSALERRAKVVENEANEELGRLVDLLDLTEAQQNRVFGLLVSNSPAFDPIMRTESGSPFSAGGSLAQTSTTGSETSPTLENTNTTTSPNTSTAEQLIASDILTDEQEADLIQDEIDRMEFWDVAIADLGQLITEEDLPQLSSPPTEEPQPAEEPWRGYEVASDDEGESEDEPPAPTKKP